MLRRPFCGSARESRRSQRLTTVSPATMATHRRSSVKEKPVTSVLSNNEVVYDPEDPDRVYNADEEVLAALGYKPEFKREFSLWSTFAVSFSVLGLLPSFASTLFYGMGYAGTAGMTWGWLVAVSLPGSHLRMLGIGRDRSAREMSP